MGDASRYLSFRGVRVHFRIASPADTPRERVLLLSSPLINSFHWRKIVPELTQLGCLSAIVDLPGFGRSDCGQDVPQDSILRANMIWGILDEIDSECGAPGSTWHLMGHGSACAVLMEMAALYPDSVKSQVHIAPLLSLPENSRMPPPGKWFLDTIYEKENFRRMIEHYCGYPLDDYIVDRMRAPLTRPGTRECFLRMLRAVHRPPDAGLGFCPAMVLIGGRDALMTPPTMDEIGRLLDGAERHTLQSAGHFPMETHSRALRDYLRGWIRYNASLR